MHYLCSQSVLLLFPFRLALTTMLSKQAQPPGDEQIYGIAGHCGDLIVTLRMHDLRWLNRSYRSVVG